MVEELVDLGQTALSLVQVVRLQVLLLGGVLAWDTLMAFRAD